MTFKSDPEERRKQKRDHNLYTRYRIRSEQYDELFKKQKGLCAICKSKEIIRDILCVDHNHQTGKIRGLLCQTCNRAIGLLKDDHKTTLRAHQYLKDNK